MQTSPKATRISCSAMAESCSMSYYFTSSYQIATWENNPQCSETLQISAEYTGDETACYIVYSISPSSTQIFANVIPFKFLFETRSSRSNIYPKRIATIEYACTANHSSLCLLIHQANWPSNHLQQRIYITPFPRFHRQNHWLSSFSPRPARWKYQTMVAQNTERAIPVRVCLFVTKRKEKKNEAWIARSAKETRCHSEWRVKSSKLAWPPPLPPVFWAISIEFYVLARCKLRVNALNLLRVWDSVWMKTKSGNATSTPSEARTTRRISRQERVESRAVEWICEWQWVIRVETQRMWTNRLRMCLWMNDWVVILTRIDVIIVCKREERGKECISLHQLHKQKVETGKPARDSWEWWSNDSKIRIQIRWNLRFPTESNTFSLFPPSNRTIARIPHTSHSCRAFRSLDSQWNGSPRLIPRSYSMPWNTVSTIPSPLWCSAPNLLPHSRGTVRSPAHTLESTDFRTSEWCTFWNSRNRTYFDILEIDAHAKSGRCNDDMKRFLWAIQHTETLLSLGIIHASMIHSALHHHNDHLWCTSML